MGCSSNDTLLSALRCSEKQRLEMAGDLSLFWKIQFKRVSFDYSNYISFVNGIELVD